MNGCQYLLPKFTIPAGSKNTSQLKWDVAFLTKEEFLAKHPNWDSSNYDTMFTETFYETRERCGASN